MSLSAEEAFREEDWRGVYYELAMEVSPTPDDARLTAALETLSASLERCPAPATNDDSLLDEELHNVEVEFLRSIYGAIAGPEGHCLGVRVLIIRERTGSDWIVLCIPSGMTDRAGYPHDQPLSEPFFSAIDRAFLDLADTVCRAAPFDLGLIGEEVSGLLHARDLRAREVRASWYMRQGGVLVRESLLQSLPQRVVAERLRCGLLYIPLMERITHVP